MRLWALWAGALSKDPPCGAGGCVRWVFQEDRSESEVEQGLWALGEPQRVGALLESCCKGGKGSSWEKTF